MSKPSGDRAFEYKTLPFELKGASDEGYGTFEGVGAVFNNVDRVNDIIAKGAFREALAEFIADGFIGGQDHDWQAPIGHPYEAKEVDDGLFIKAVFDNTPEAQATRAKMTANPISKRATIKKLSIGYRTVESKDIDAGEVDAYWAGVGYTPSADDLERSRGGIRLLTKLKLYEVSPVLRAANDLASIHGVKSSAPEGFAEHSQLVASTLRESLEEVEAFFKRFEGRAEARFKEGRELSATNWNAMKDVYDRHVAAGEELEAIGAKMAAILERTKPKPKDPGKSEPDAKTSPETTAAPAIDQADVMARYARILYATNPALGAS
jgi:HK97 family phage prohead protease